MENIKGKKIIKFLKNPDNFHIYIFVSIAVIFSILFSYYSILKAFTINAYGFDLGLYSQSLYSAIHGQFFYTNLIGESYLAEHFSPFMFLLVIPYYFYPSPYILLILQSIFLSFSIIPLYYISKIILESAREKSLYPKNINIMSLILAISFILSPLTESPVYFDFHLMVFLPFFFFMSFYFFLKGNKIMNGVFLALIVSLHASFIFIVAMLLLMEFIWNINKYNNKKEKIKGFSFFIIFTFILLFYYIFASFMKGYINDITNIQVFISGSTGAASKSITGLFYMTLFNPSRMFYFLQSNYLLKILFVLLAFMGVDFLFINYPLGLLPAIPYFAFAMLSTYIPYYFIGFQYSMMLIPFVFLSGILGASRVITRINKNPARIKKIKRNFRNSFIAIISFAIVAFIVLSPISPLSVEPNSIHALINDNSGMPREKQNFIYNISSDIGKNSSVITGNTIFPLLYSDLNATAFPYSPVNLTVPHYKYLIADFNNSQTYVKNYKNISLANLASEYISSGYYGIYAEGYGVIVLERNYTEKPVMFTPYQVNFSGKCFVSNSGSLSGPYLNGNVSYLNQMEKKAGNSYSRNLTYLLPGDYNFTLDLSSVPPQSIVHITIYSGGEIFYRSFNSSKVITFNYTIKEYEPNVYFAINDSKGSVSVNNLRFDMYNYYQINS